MVYRRDNVIYVTIKYSFLRKSKNPDLPIPNVFNLAYKFCWSYGVFNII